MTDLLLGALRLEMCPISTYLLLLLLLLYFIIYLKIYFKLLLLFAVNFTYFSKLYKVSLIFFYKKILILLLLIIIIIIIIISIYVVYASQGIQGRFEIWKQVLTIF